MRSWIFAFALPLILPVAAQAANNTWQGTVTTITQNTQTSGGNPQNIGYLTLSGTYNGTHPSCATNTTAVAFDPTTIGGQNAFRALMAAKLAGSVVQIFTTGACSVGINTEDVILFNF